MGMRLYCAVVDGGVFFSFFFSFCFLFPFPFCCMSSTMVFYALSAFFAASHLPFSSLIVSLILIELYIETGDLEGVYARGWVGRVGGGIPGGV